jgi:phenylpropionate dioxygenase-like ring-hydroxylating dioxygenase large terminal subunit
MTIMAVVFARSASAQSLSAQPGLWKLEATFFISPFPDWGIVCRVFPLGPGRIRFFHDIMVPPEAMAQPDFQEKVAIADKFFSDVNEEDVRVCTAVQRCLESRYAQRGSLGRLEGHNRDFALWVARQLTT